MTNQKYRVSLKENISRGTYFTNFINISNLEDLLIQLEKHNIDKVTFKYNSYFWEGENSHSDLIPIKKINQALFNWIIDKVEGNHKFIEIYKKKK